MRLGSSRQAISEPISRQRCGDGGADRHAARPASANSHRSLLRSRGHGRGTSHQAAAAGRVGSSRLADLARVNYLPTVWLAPASTRQLRRLVRHRAQLVKRRRDVKLRIRGLLRENRLRCGEAVAWRKAWLVWLTQEAKLPESDRWIMEDHLAELAALANRIAAVEAKIK